MKLIPGRMYKVLRSGWLVQRCGELCLYTRGELVLVVNLSRDRVTMVGSDGSVRSVIPQTGMFRWVKLS